MSRQAVAELLRDRLTALGMQGKDLAAKVGRDPGTISKWVNGKQLPDPKLVPLLAEALKVDELAIWRPFNAAQGEENAALQKENRLMVQRFEVMDANIDEIHRGMQALTARLDGLLDVLLPLVQGQPGMPDLSHPRDAEPARPRRRRPS